MTVIALVICVVIITLPFAFRYRTVEVTLAIQPENDSSPYRTADGALTKQSDNSTSSSMLQVSSLSVEVGDLWHVRGFVLMYRWLYNIFFYTTPLILLVIFNSFIIRALWRTREHRRKFPARRRITMMLVAVTLVFMTCITPDAVLSTVFGLGYTDSGYLIRGIREITDMLVTVNSAVDFLLYCSFHEAFRQRFTRLLTCCTTRGRTTSGTLGRTLNTQPQYLSCYSSPELQPGASSLVTHCLRSREKRQSVIHKSLVNRSASHLTVTSKYNTKLKCAKLGKSASPFNCCGISTRLLVTATNKRLFRH